MYNICQLTNFDLGSAAVVQEGIHKGGDKGETIVYDYKVITAQMLGSEYVTKFGYCVNNNTGINYPIFLTLNNVKHEFQIGKTGMFEFQPEEWYDINEQEESESIDPKIAKVYLSEVEVPADIPFVIDYAYEL